MARRTKWLIGGGIILAIIIVGAIVGGGSNTTKTTTATPPSLAVLEATTTTVASTTTTDGAKPSGGQVVAWLKSQSMPDDPMMAPLTDARWTGDQLTLVYQGEPELAARVCEFTAINLPGNLGVKDLGGVFVQRGDGKLLARTQLTKPGCKAY